VIVVEISSTLIAFFFPQITGDSGCNARLVS
jgi:hypothetical protein